jgi:hypothetical protein
MGIYKKYHSGVLSINPAFFLLFLTGLTVSSCQKKPRFYDLQIDNSNALRVNITFTMNRLEKPILYYWESAKPDGLYRKVLDSKEEQEIVLYNLKPDTRYAFSVAENNGPDVKRSDTILFETPRMPYTLPRLNIMIDSGNVFDGYIMVRKVEAPAQQLLINHEGDIVWYHQFDTILSRFFSWTEQSTILSLHDENKIVEFDLAGNILNSLEYGKKGFDRLLHHEIIKNDNSEILSLTRNMQVFDLRKFGGIENDTIYGDGILVMDKEGNKIWEWDMFQFENPLKDENINNMKKDWSHGNSLAIDQDGHYLISFRNFHQIWKIHSQNGEILWKIGMDGDFSLQDDEIFYSQHTAFNNRYNELMIFDNGGPDRMLSRAITFDIDGKGEYHSGRIRITLPGDMYSFKEGSAYLIGEDKLLFCSSRTNNLVITDLEGSILWQIRSSESFFRAYYIDEIPAFD